MPSALLLTGTVGAGKTTTADAVGLLLEAASVPHAIIDLDEIRRLWPKPPSDPFASEVELRNVESLASNYLAAGADRLVLAGVCETWTQRRRYESAVAVPLVVCRLHAPPDALTARLRDRHRDEPTELGLAPGPSPRTRRDPRRRRCGRCRRRHRVAHAPRGCQRGHRANRLEPRSTAEWQPANGLLT